MSDRAWKICGIREMCARCRVKPMMSNGTGCLCIDCEDAIADMTQEQVDADRTAVEATR